jgi:O-antigen/teichoic acid export membrane protein
VLALLPRERMADVAPLTQGASRRASRSRLVGQSAGFAVSAAAVAGLGAISTALAARALSTQGFGSLTFAVSFLALTSLFFDFGLFLPASRMVAMAPAREQREITGAALVAFLPVGLLFSTATFALSFGVDAWFNVHAGTAIRLIAPLALVYPFHALAGGLAQGTGRLHIYSVTAVLSQAAYVLALAIIAATHAKLTVARALELRLVGMLLASVVLVVWLMPLFGRVVDLARQMVSHARSYGFQTYIGAVLGIATYNMDVLMVGGMTTANEVAYYGLAGSMAYLVGLPAYGMCKTLFPEMTASTRLDNRWVGAAAISGVICATSVVLLSRPAISLIFSSRYAGAIGLVPPLAMAEAVRGVTTVYNSFLSAQGRGKELRNAAFVLTGSNLALNLALIPPFGALGAAWASLGALVVNLFAHVVLYRRCLAATALVAA